MLTPIRILFLSIVTLVLAPAWSAEDPAPGTLEVVAEPPINPGNLAVTADGRVFATVHQFNDLAVDDERGFVYIADVGGTADPALVTVGLDAGASHRFTASKSLQTEDVDLVVEGRVIRLPGKDGPKPARIAVNPITLSADGETLYSRHRSCRSLRERSGPCHGCAMERGPGVGSAPSRT